MVDLGTADKVKSQQQNLKLSTNLDDHGTLYHDTTGYHIHTFHEIVSMRIVHNIPQRIHHVTDELITHRFIWNFCILYAVFPRVLEEKVQQKSTDIAKD